MHLKTVDSVAVQFYPRNVTIAYIVCLPIIMPTSFPDCVTIIDNICIVPVSARRNTVLRDQLTTCIITTGRRQS